MTANRTPDRRAGPGAPAPSGAGEPVPGLAAARLWAATHFPYLATGLFGAHVISASGIATVAVDEHWRMHADPDLAAGWTPAEFGSVLVHHVSHLLRSHGERAIAAGVGPGGARAWVRAADAEINDDLVPAGLDLPGDPVLPHHLGAEPGRLAEDYYAAAGGPGHRPSAQGWSGCGPGSPVTGGQQAPAPDGKPGDYGQGLDCGSGADGCPRPWDRGSGPPGLSPWQARLLCRQVAQDCLRHGREAGTLPGGLLRWATQVLEPRVDWRRLLRAELRRAVADTVGAVDYSYRRPSRRASVAGDVVLPALRRPVPEVAVVCDTSGSMSDDLLAASLAEVEGLLRSLGLARRLRVLACDAAAGPARRVSSVTQIELTGGGGTDMGAGIDAAAALRPRPLITVVLTDGYTPWPDDAPAGMKVVVGLLGGDPPQAPAWARTVRIPPG